MHRIVLATHNAGKVKEIKHLLEDLPIEVASLLDYPDIPETIEDQPTFEGNAWKKGREAFQRTGIPSLADDSGLEVRALGMRPGVISARYAGEKVTYADNNRKLLTELRGIPPEHRDAQFRCVAAFVSHDREKITQGICPGTIADAPRGNGGFGYDPLFIPEGYAQTFAELSIAIKNTMSHRAIAFLEMKRFLRQYLTGQPGQ